MSLWTGGWARIRNIVELHFRDGGATITNASVSPNVLLIDGGDVNSALRINAGISGGTLRTCSLEFYVTETKRGRIYSFPNGAVALGFYGDNANLKVFTIYTNGAIVMSGEADSDITFNQYNANGTPKLTYFILDGATGNIDLSQAIIMARMTTTERDALTPINGMVIYNTTTNAFNFYENGAWVTK